MPYKRKGTQGKGATYRHHQACFPMDKGTCIPRDTVTPSVLLLFSFSRQEVPKRFPLPKEEC